MKALITAGGRATRLRPITETLNKHLIPLAGKPMIVHAIEKIVEAGIVDIGINVNPGEAEMQRVLGDGSHWNARITYLEQVGGPKGLAHILRNAEPFLAGGPFLFYLGDNIILGSIAPFVRSFREDGLDCLLALARVKDPQRFGVPVFEGGRIVRVDEKPSDPQSDFAVTGIYVYGPEVFKAVDAVEPSPRGEYEISDVNSWLIRKGYAVGHREITGWWKDTGKPEDLLEGNQLLLSEMPRLGSRLEGVQEAGAVFHGMVRVGPGTRIGSRTVIRGPVVIGANCDIDDAYIAPYTSIGRGVFIRSSEIEHSIVFDGARIEGADRVIDSIIGKNAVVRAGVDARPRGVRLVVGDNSTVDL